MNLFEKIFNYQIISRLEDSGAFMVTSHERAWLKMMLQHPAAIDAFSADTLEKLQSLLVGDDPMDTGEHLLEKARSLEKQVYHPLLRPLRRFIMNKQGIRITYRIKGGREYSDQSGIPYRLEYSMVKREWYLLWHHSRHRSFMSTRLHNIIAVSKESVPSTRIERTLAFMEHTLEGRRETAVIQVVQAYNPELSRILYAFSCFEKHVHYDEEANLYHIHVSFLGDESEYVLSKIRFLGKRVRVVDNDYFIRRMLESSTKALERYGIGAELTPSPE